jgi:hypothetical protein
MQLLQRTSVHKTDGRIMLKNGTLYIIEFNEVNRILSYFEMGVLLYILGWPPTRDSSASHVAGISGIHHCTCPKITFSAALQIY